VYAMGENSRGQLGTGTTSNKGSPLPCFLEELSFKKISKVRAGSFSAVLSSDNQLYVWGEGSFGFFYSPYQIKTKKPMEI